MTAWLLSMEVESDDPRCLDEPSHVEAIADGIASLLHFAVIGELRHEFEPQGFSLMRFGNAARVAIHTWPEAQAATIDIWLAPSAAGRCRRDELGAWLAEAHGLRVLDLRDHVHALADQVEAPRAHAEI